MDRNFLLAFGLSLLVITLWMSMQPAPQREGENPTGESTAEQVAPAPQAGAPAAGGEQAPGSDIPSWEPTMPSLPSQEQEPEAAFPEAGPSEPAVPGRTVDVETDLFHVELTSRGAALTKFELKRYDDASLPGRPPVHLVTNAPDVPPALATPFRELGVGPWGTAEFQVSQPDRHHVVFTRTHEGVTLRKTYGFEDGRYDFTLLLELENGTERTLEPIYETIWPAVHQESGDYKEFSLVAYREEEGLEQMILSGRGGGAPGCGGFGGSDEPKTFSGDVHWAGAQTRYFLAAIIPEVSSVAMAGFLPVREDEVAVTRVGQAKIQLRPGASQGYEYRVYVGPKERDRLEAGVLGAAQLDEATKLGYRWVAPLSRFFSWLLAAIYEYVPNYGWVIILVTILVRLVTAPLLGRQMRSMRKMSTQMQALKPRLDEVKEKYGDDRQRMSEETMKAYREAGVNPLGMLGGCLPLFLQFPVFIGLFYALQGSIELRQAPFIGWIDDLSVPEALFMIPGLDLPLRVLPLIMGASMWLQQKLTPQTSMDPAQQQMMMTLMPVMFTVLFYQFPSGLVLYWMVSNLLAIAHQSWINRTTPA